MSSTRQTNKEWGGIGLGGKIRWAWCILRGYLAGKKKLNIYSEEIDCPCGANRESSPPVRDLVCIDGMERSLIPDMRMSSYTIYIKEVWNTF